MGSTSVVEYKLPPIPIRETDKRQNNFLAKYGVEGATELDALEALYPGELECVICKAVAPYRDTSVRRQIERVGAETRNRIARRWDESTASHRQRLRQLEAQTATILDGYRERLEALRDALRCDLSPIGRELESLRQAIKTEFEEFEPNLPDRPTSQLTLPEQFAGLFDSRRAYLEQLKFYKAVAAEHAGEVRP